MKIFKKMIIGVFVLFLLLVITSSYLWVRMINEMQSATTGDETLICTVNRNKMKKVNSLFIGENHELKTHISEDGKYFIYENDDGRWYNILTSSGDVYSWSDVGIGRYWHDTDIDIWRNLKRKQGTMEILKDFFTGHYFFGDRSHALLNYYYAQDCSKEKTEESPMSVPVDIYFYERVSRHKNFECDDDYYLPLDEGRLFLYEGEKDTVFNLRLLKLETETIMIKEDEGLYVGKDNDYILKETDDVYSLEKNDEIIASGCRVVEYLEYQGKE